VLLLVPTNLVLAIRKRQMLFVTDFMHYPASTTLNIFTYLVYVVRYWWYRIARLFHNN